jgi:uncharacterized protein YjbJ (UPF0337 family)
MDQDRVEGATDQAKGNVKETIGKMTVDTKTEGEGMYDKAKGKAQNAAGGLKDKARDILDDK